MICSRVNSGVPYTFDHMFAIAPAQGVEGDFTARTSVLAIADIKIELIFPP